MLPDGFFSEFVPSGRQVLFGTLSNSGAVGGIILRLFGLLAYERSANGLRLFDVRAAGGLPRNEITGGKSTDDPDLTVASHPEPLSLCRKSGLVDTTTSAMTLVENEAFVCSHAPNCTDDR